MQSSCEKGVMANVCAFIVFISLKEERLTDIFRATIFIERAVKRLFKICEGLIRRHSEWFLYNLKLLLINVYFFDKHFFRFLKSVQYFFGGGVTTKVVSLCCRERYERVCC